MSKTVLVLMVIALMAGCSAAQFRVANYAGAVFSTTTIAVDWCQTRSAALDGWSGGRSEGGMPTSRVIGTTPGSGAVDLYFLATTVVVLASAQFVPERARPALYAAVAGVELVTIRENVDTTRVDCWR